jgi:hopanoid biosynthesis associated protein HpnK
LKRLIVTADDFGAAHEINDAVEAAHRDGILSAASLMVAAPAAADAIARARRLPRLRVGLHLVLSEGRPLLSASRLGHLVDDNGFFRANLAALGTLIACSRQARRQVAAEISAQFEAFRDTGLALDHCNAHQHFHLHPVIARLLIAIGRSFGLRAVRLPLEPARLLPKAGLGGSRAAPLLTLPFARMLRRRLRAAGLLAPDRVFGLQWSGQMTRTRLVALIRNLPMGLSEIYLHPATGGFVGAAPGYRYREEFEALIDRDVVAACRDPSLELGGFSDFADAGARSVLPADTQGGTMSHRMAVRS